MFSMTLLATPVATMSSSIARLPHRLMRAFTAGFATNCDVRGTVNAAFLRFRGAVRAPHVHIADEARQLLDGRRLPQQVPRLVARRHPEDGVYRRAPHIHSRVPEEANELRSLHFRKQKICRA